jgi:hypothetical protein
MELAVRVGDSSALSAVSCPSTSLCVAVDGSGDVIASTNPAGGSGAWASEHVDSQVFAECLENPDSAASCQPGFVGISCPSGAGCVAVDSAGYAFSDLAATGATSTWRGAAAAGPSVDAYDALYCSSASLCIATCPVGVGSGACQGSIYGAGDVVSWDPTAWNPPETPATFATISPQPLMAAWCFSTMICFTANTVGDLYSSANPTGPATTWDTSYVDSDPILGGTCLSASTCIATDQGGSILLGEALTTANIKKLLANTIVPPRKTISVAAMLKHGYTLHLNVPASGHMTVSWYEAHKGTHLTTKEPGAILIAHGAGTLKAGTNELHLTLTPKGRVALKADKSRLRLTAVEVFTPVAHPAATITKQFVLDP